MRKRKSKREATALEKEYRKARHAAAQRLSIERKKAKEAGREFNKTLPVMPKRITEKSIERINRFARKPAKSKREATALEKEYRKARHAAAQRLSIERKKAREAGKEFNKKLPSMPKRITEKSVEKIKGFNRKIKRNQPKSELEKRYFDERKGALERKRAGATRETTISRIPKKITEDDVLDMQSTALREDEIVLAAQKPSKKRLQNKSTLISYGDMVYENLHSEISKFASDTTPIYKDRAQAIKNILESHREDFHNIYDRADAERIAQISAEFTIYVYDSDGSERSAAFDKIYSAILSIGVLNADEEEKVRHMQREDENALPFSIDDEMLDEY